MWCGAHRQGLGLHDLASNNAVHIAMRRKSRTSHEPQLKHVVRCTSPRLRAQGLGLRVYSAWPRGHRDREPTCGG
eukprot:1049113-Pyramimonas_sp.AAC.1